MIGLFETMLVVDGRVLFAAEHLARMTRSALALRLPPPDPAEFHRRVRAAATNDAVRCDYIGGALDAYARPILARTLARREHGRAITLGASLVRPQPEHKLTSYEVCTIGLERAAAAGADEGLFVTPEGAVLEGTATNVFAVTERTLVTAPDGVLPGITRAWVIATAAALGVEIEYRAPRVEELREGALLTGSLTTVAPLRVLDGAPCRAPGEIYEMLAARWRETCASPPHS